MDNTNAENNKKKMPDEKINKILLITGFALIGIQLAATVVFMVILGKLSVIPKDYVILIDILLVLFALVFLIAQRWKLIGIITKAVSVIMTIVIIVASVYLNMTYNVFNKTTGVKYKVVTISVYVLADSGLTSMEEIRNETFGIVAELDRVNTNETINSIQSELRQTISTAEYTDTQTLVKALYDGEVKAIIMNEAYIGIIEQTEGYEDFSHKVKKISSYKKNESIDISGTNNKTSDDVVVIYISGVDVEGTPTENRNSDVNIIMVINKKTHQIMLLNTPRDFYVPLSVSNGVRDKLTHAGCIGVDCSVETLEMLYGINIDYYIKLNFTGFVNIIDALGGIDVYSEYEFTSYHGKYYFSVGYNHMNGQQALGFSRERYAFPTGDNQRGRNQMAVITALVKKLSSSELLKNYKDVINSISSCMVTDMTMDDIGDLVDFHLKEGISWDIVQFAVGGTGDMQAGYSYSIPNYVMVPDEVLVNMAKDYLNQIIAGEIVEIIN